MADASGYIKPYLQTRPDVTEGIPERVEADPECAKAKREVIALLPDDIDGYILSIGPAAGWELDELRKRCEKSTNILGVTPFEEEAELCRALGHTCVIGDMHKLACLWSGMFSLVFASHVLEHSPAPYVALREFYRMLRPGGYVQIVTPEPYGVIHLGDIERAKRHVDIPEHIFLPSAETLIVMLRKAGFNFLRYSEVAQTCQGKLNYWHRVWLAQKPSEVT